MKAKPSGLSPQELRQWAERARQLADRANSLMPLHRQKLRQKGNLLEWWASRKSKKHARQNRHPEHLTKQ
jgi:hypothetical protein